MTTCVTARSWICEPALWQPRLESANPDPYTHQMTLQRHPVWQPGLGSANPDPYTTRRHLQRHPVWQPGLGSANPDPYTHHTTPPTTPCVTARSWICEPWPLHTPHNTSNDTLCDSPVLDLRTLTPTPTRRHLQRHPVWQPPPQRTHKICEPSPTNLK